MAKRTSKSVEKPTKEGRLKEGLPAPLTAQFSFAFIEAPQPRVSIEAPGVTLEGEIALPAEQRAEAAAAAHIENPAEQQVQAISEGVLEHAFFLQQSSKYEDRLFKAILALVAAEVLCILVKGGIAISPKLLEQWGIATDNLRLICGILGGASLIFMGTVLYFVLRANEYVPQKQMHFPPRRAVVGMIATGLLIIGCVVLTAGFFITVWQTFWDMIYLFHWIADHLIYVLDGWAPQQLAPVR